MQINLTVDDIEISVIQREPVGFFKQTGVVQFFGKRDLFIFGLCPQPYVIFGAACHTVWKPVEEIGQTLRHKTQNDPADVGEVKQEGFFFMSVHHPP